MRYGRKDDATRLLGEILDAGVVVDERTLVKDGKEKGKREVGEDRSITVTKSGGGATFEEMEKHCEGVQCASAGVREVKVLVPEQGSFLIGEGKGRLRVQARATATRATLPKLTVDVTGYSCFQCPPNTLLSLSAQPRVA